MIRLVVKTAVSAALIWLLLRNTDVAGLANQLLQVGWITLLGAAALLGGLVFPATLRWQLVLSALGSRLGFWSAWRMVMVGLFFNQVLPSSMGGDAVRVWQAHRNALDLRRAIHSVLIDRLMALGVLFLITSAALPRLFEIVPVETVRWGLALVALGGLLGYTLFANLDRIPALLLKWRVTRSIAALSTDLRHVLVSARFGIPALVLSLLIQAVVALVVFLLSRSLGLTANLLDCAVLMPAVVLVTALPISIAGWGVREGAMVVAFSFIGVSNADALALSVLFGAASMCGGLPGGLVWLFSSLRSQGRTQQRAEK